MTLDEYQQQAIQTATYDDVGENLSYPSLGLGSEAGEYLGKIKRLLHRSDKPPIEDLLLELGDVLWYVAMCAYELGYSLNDIAVMNQNKLLMRAALNTLAGTGDHR